VINKARELSKEEEACTIRRSVLFEPLFNIEPRLSGGRPNEADFAEFGYTQAVKKADKTGKQSCSFHSKYPCEMHSMWMINL